MIIHKDMFILFVLIILGACAFSLFYGQDGMQTCQQKHTFETCHHALHR